MSAKKMMTAAEMKDYLLSELDDEKQKMLRGEENKYSYLFMLCNDMGLTIEEQPKRYVYTEKGAAAVAWRFPGVKAGDTYNRPVSKSCLRQYVKTGFIAEAK